MRNKFFNFFLILLIAGMTGGAMRAYAQNDTSKADVSDLQTRWDTRGSIKPDTTKFDSLNWSRAVPKDFRTWEIGLRVGFTFPTTQIDASDFNTDYAHTNYGLGLTVAHFLTHTFGLQLEYYYATLSGQNALPGPYSFKTTVYYDVSINTVFRLGDIRFLSRTPRWGIYGSLGVGLVHFTPINDSAGTVLNYNYYVPGFYGALQHANYSNTTAPVIPLTAGINYLISDQFSASLNYSWRDTRTFKLAGWWRNLSNNDNYTLVSLGLIYHVGHKNKGIIEWTDPVEAMYDTCYNPLIRLKASIDSLKRDTDKDGVSDYFDKDNQTPKGFMVYGNGTAWDFDGDGVPDAIDFCPTVAGPVSNHGCPIEKVAPIEAAKPVEPIVEKQEATQEESALIEEVFKNLQFETAKSIIRESSYLSLNKLAAYLKVHPSYRLLIEGNTDNVGGAAYNMKLSSDRANSVKQYFMDKGIEDSRLTAKGYGLTKPVADNKTPEGRQMNRRVDFTLIK